MRWVRAESGGQLMFQEAATVGYDQPRSGKGGMPDLAAWGRLISIYTYHRFLYTDRAYKGDRDIARFLCYFL
jgi:hypothetical protein